LQQCDTGYATRIYKSAVSYGFVRGPKLENAEQEVHASYSRCFRET